MEQMIEKDRNTQRLVIKSLTNQNQIKRLINEFNQFFLSPISLGGTDAEVFKNQVNELFRVVHTFKGDFAQFGFLRASEHIHELEDKLGELQQGGLEPGMALSLLKGFDPEEALREDKDLVREILGEDFFDQADSISIPKEKLDNIEAFIQQSGADPNGGLLRLIRSLRLQNVKTLLEQYFDYIVYLADKLVKEVPVYNVVGDDVFINEDKYKDVLKSLVHIFRNSMDHGIESADQRISTGKSENGHITCLIKQNENTFTIAISDDGRGLDLEAISNKAVHNGLYVAEMLDKMSREELGNLIFLDNFSTAETVSGISGRGVGMSAVKHCCESLGGEIKVLSTDGLGTTFKLTFPRFE
jgi:two-component system chemotaxis sensor kinase CheA